MYKGGVGQWSWIFHRITGVGVLLFLLIHVLDTALIMLGPEAYDHVMAIYKHPLFRPMEVLLFAMVLYHALNGVRIIIIDFWSQGPRYHQQLFYIVMVLFVIGWVVGSYYMVRPLFN